MTLAIAYPRSFWVHKHSPTRRHYIEALQRATDCVFVAPGWKGYDESRTWDHNRGRLCPDAEAAIFYKPEGHKYSAPMVGWQESPLLKVTCFNEFWWDRDRRIAETAGFDLCIAHHENDLERFHEIGVNVAHIPHSADIETFHATTQDRTGSPLLSGTCGREHYPFRCRLQQGVQSGRIPGRIRPHPGYWMKSERENLRQVEDYAADLASSSISYCTSSRWRYALAKYFESWMSGCVVAGDLPDDETYRRNFEDLQVVLERDWSDEQIRDAVESPSRQDLNERAAEGQERCLRLFSTDLYADRLIGVLRDCLAST